jgi:trehalose/maltose hydrolase-like predicted phosphorylase
MLDVAARLDLDDLTGTTAGGLHIACMGGVWQALVFGFMGARMAEGVLHLAPIIPEQWRSLRAALTVRGTPVVVKAEPERLQVDAEEPLAVDLGGTRFPPKSGRRVFRHTSVGWNESHG